MCQVNWQAGRQAHLGQAGRPAGPLRAGRQAGPLGAGRQVGPLGIGMQAGQLGAGRQAGGYKYFAYKWLGLAKAFPITSHFTKYVTYLLRYDPPNHPRILNSH